MIIWSSDYPPKRVSNGDSTLWASQQYEGPSLKAHRRVHKDNMKAHHNDHKDRPSLKRPFSMISQVHSVHPSTNGRFVVNYCNWMISEKLPPKPSGQPAVRLNDPEKQLALMKFGSAMSKGDKFSLSLQQKSNCSLARSLRVCFSVCCSRF